MNTSDATVRVILGPTAAGKSSLALRLAESLGLALVSADSRQVYTGFDIGTGKPSPKDLARAPHFGVSMRSATERYSAHQWATDAEAWMREAREEGHPSVIVGGTGFYVRALVQPLHGAPPLDADRRRALEEVLADFPAGRLARWCARLDPARALLGPTQQRRAVETALLAGVRLSDVHRGAGHAESAPRQHSATESRAVRYLVVDPGPVLAERIRARVHAMVDAGWFEEVESLMGHIPPDAPAWNACGYGTMRAAVRGELARDAAIERVVIETRQYAKRQRTWCRHQLVEGPVTRIDPDAPGAYERVLAWWNHNGAEDA